MPKFSIIIPVYNVAPYLRECLDSVLAQTFTDWEAICVDDGSTDGSDSILDEFAVADARFVVEHRRNEGVVSARSRGHELVRGEWVAYLDGDDLIDSTRLENIVKAVDVSKADMVIVNYEGFRDGRTIDLTGRRIESSDIHTLQGEDLVRQGWEILSVGGLSARYVLRREIVQGAGACRFASGVRYAEDSLLALRALSRSRRLALVGDCGYRYRWRECSATSKPLESRERLAYFTELADIIACYQIDSTWSKETRQTVLWHQANAVWTNLVRMAILLFDSDSDSVRGIWKLTRGLIAPIGGRWFIPCRLYVAFGWLWPTRVLYRTGVAFVALKRMLRSWAGK